MGLSLEAQDFQILFQKLHWVVLGVVLQYTIMPLLGFVVASAFALPSSLFLGVVLVASCPGGTASNVICYLARANLPLSVVLTSISTVLAVALTPFWVQSLAGNQMEVDGWGLFRTTVQVVLLPVVFGLLTKRFLPKVQSLVEPWAPLVSILLISMIVSSILAKGRLEIREFPLHLLLVVFLLHSLGFLLGYVSSYLLT